MFLVCGFSITTLIAWGASWRSRSYTPVRTVLMTDSAGRIAFHEIACATSSVLITTIDDTEYLKTLSAPIEELHSPTVVDVWLARPAFRARRDLMSDACYGWPVVSFRWQYAMRASGFSVSGIQIGNPPFVLQSRHGAVPLVDLPQVAGVVLPIEPLWGGVVIDTVTWGAVAVCITAGWRRFRCAMRRLACRCANCGYDMKGNATARCPECGRDYP